jgi:hypothetical protein
MPLLLKPVAPARGYRWLGDAFRLYARRPLAFTMMFTVFLAAAFLLAWVPLLGNLLPLMLAPMLSLGFMVACQSALLDGPVHPRQFIEPLRGDPVRRRALIVLSVVYGCAALAILYLCELVSGGAMQRLQEVMANSAATPAEVTAALSDPGLSASWLTGLLLGTLLSAPFWHAPALVHWGAQSAGQALFSSTLAVWRTKGAFFCYALAWLAVFAGFGIVSAVLLGLLGLSVLAQPMAVAAGLLFSTVFYVSLLFTFNDSFGGA